MEHMELTATSNGEDKAKVSRFPTGNRDFTPQFLVDAGATVNGGSCHWLDKLCLIKEGSFP
jgi:hypothetical protein